MSLKEIKDFLEKNQDFKFFVSNLGLVTKEVRRLFELETDQIVKDRDAFTSVLHYSPITRDSADGVARRYFGHWWALRSGIGVFRTKKTGGIGTQSIYFDFPPATRITRIYFEIRSSPKYSRHTSPVAELIDIIATQILTLPEILHEYKKRLRVDMPSLNDYMKKAIELKVVTKDDIGYYLTDLTRTIHYSSVVGAWQKWQNHPARIQFYP